VRRSAETGRFVAEDTLERFLAYVDFRTGRGGCWLWTGYRNEKGYGQFFDGRPVRAHRFAYEWCHPGELRDDSTIEHLCRNRACVNPEHLAPLSRKMNVLIGNTITAENARKTHCKDGHPLDGHNLYIKPNGQRQCVACRREAGRRYKARKRGFVG
jgi:HNH endonuclease